MRWLPTCEESLDAFLDEYRQTIGSDLSSKSRTLTIWYPGMSLFNQSVKMNETISEKGESSDSSRSSNLVSDNSIDENCKEVSQNIPCLKQISSLLCRWKSSKWIIWQMN
jgi:hypothetical protein